MAKAKTINEKLKASVDASLAKATKAKKQKRPKIVVDPEPEPEYSKTGFECIGIPKSGPRPREWAVYRITYHNRARLDHSKYPNERMRIMENSPLFCTCPEAQKWCNKKNKEDRTNLYYPEMTWMPEPEIPAALLKKIKQRGW